MTEEKPKKLQQALLEAQLLIAPIVKDAKNEHQKYRYVKGETIFMVSSRALLACGLVARRRSWETAKEATHSMYMAAKGDKEGEKTILVETRNVSMTFELFHP